MKKLTIKLMLFFTVLLQVYLTSCNDSGTAGEPDFPAFIAAESFYEGSPGETITIDGRNMSTPSDIEIVINEDFSISPSEITDENIQFVIPQDFSSGKMQIIADDEVIANSYFKFLDNTGAETLGSGLSIAAIDFVSAEFGVYLDSKDILYKTVDGGQTWVQIGDGAYQNTIYAVSDQKVWIQKDHRTLERTQDGGNTWDEVRILDNMLIDHFYASLDQVLVIATIRDEDISRLYSSEDNGDTWEVVLTSETESFE